MDAANDPTKPDVYVMTSAQVGKTEILNNLVGYYVDQDPAPMLVMQPTLEMGQAWSKDRLAPMLRDTPQLKGKVKDPRTRDSGNTLLHKTFPGGHITIAGANSPAGLASRPIRAVLADEIDRYPVSAGAEGDPLSLARKRSTTFWNRKTICPGPMQYNHQPKSSNKNARWKTCRLICASVCPRLRRLRTENGIATPTMNIKNGWMRSQNRKPAQGWW